MDKHNYQHVSTKQAKLTGSSLSRGSYTTISFRTRSSGPAVQLVALSLIRLRLPGANSPFPSCYQCPFFQLFLEKQFLLLLNLTDISEQIAPPFLRSQCPEIRTRTKVQRTRTKYKVRVQKYKIQNEFRFSCNTKSDILYCIALCGILLSLVSQQFVLGR